MEERAAILESIRICEIAGAAASAKEPSDDKSAITTLGDLFKPRVMVSSRKDVTIKTSIKSKDVPQTTRHDTNPSQELSDDFVLVDTPDNS